uniref:Uncharacterized protein n=1 Tax=Rhizophora mucronata TaxID=61149 RepID=A0A2P2PY33_RHIMU
MSLCWACPFSMIIKGEAYLQFHLIPTQFHLACDNWLHYCN